MADICEHCQSDHGGMYCPHEHKLKCDVCGKPAIGVCSSAMGPVSHAYCGECNALGREPWTTLVGGLAGCRKGTIAEWVQPYIDATCKFYNKTEDDLWAEILQLENEMEKLSG